jgi:molybdopterin-guanine dinucleotide biosynthesis protein A
MFIMEQFFHGNSILPVGVILAGGASKRFGSVKALAKLNGETLVSRVVGVLKQAGFKVMISAGLGESFSFLNCPIILDDDPFQGPLFALGQIFLKTNLSKVLLLPCDMPFLSVALLQYLWQQSSGGWVTALTNQDGWRISLPAVYSREILPILENLIQTGRRDLKALFAADFPQTILSYNEWTQKIAAGDQLININTTADLSDAAVRLTKIK